MSSSAQLLLSSVRVPPAQDLSSLMASTNQVLLSMNNQMQQISSAFTLTKPTSTTDGTFGGITVGNITMGSKNYIRGGALGYNSGTGFWMGYDTGAPAGYKFFIGSAAGNKLLWNGSSLSITGSITATSGTIGGWTIGATALTSGSGATTVALDSGGINPAIYAGSATALTAPFRVTNAGVMYASGATLVGNMTIASTNRVLATDNSNYLTWQGPSGANTPGFYTQQSSAAGGFSAYGVGSGSPSIGLYRSNGSYGTPTNLAANSVVAGVFVQGYLSGGYNQIGGLRWGTIANGNTNYFRVQVSDAASANVQNWLFNYDGKLYFLGNDTISPLSSLYSAPYVADPKANIYKSATGVIKTDGDFNIAGALTFDGTGGVSSAKYYMGSGTVPTIEYSYATGSYNSSMTLATNSYSFRHYFDSLGASSPTIKSTYELSSLFGTTELTMQGCNGVLATGPNIVVKNTETDYAIQITSKYVAWTRVAGSASASKIDAIGINNIAITGRVDFLNDVSFGVYNAGASAITGYIYIYDNAGNARKLAVIA